MTFRGAFPTNAAIDHDF
ncbi:hypothetical protein Goshw_016404 [Gossypium schwendimanii]|uniref:Uncharacterized protein n=1 Tax=Gossypium schwendimanii TaxID=34291 RepID=A0A7J9LN96_GOSSC|nr:hypothetical protein [Gossypium schwendimanii]